MYFCVGPKPVLRFVGQGWALYRFFSKVVTAIECGLFPVRMLRPEGGRVPNFSVRPSSRTRRGGPDVTW
jgi:hypothetical protein